MADEEPQAKDSTEEPTEGEPTSDTLDDRQKAFIEVADGVAKDIDAERLVDLAQKGAEYEKRVEKEEQQAWEQRNKEKEASKEPAIDDADVEEYVTKEDVAKMEARIRKEHQADLRTQAQSVQHAENLKRYGLNPRSAKAQQLKYVVDGYLANQPNADIDKLYDGVAKEWGLELPAGKDKISEAAQLANAQTPGRGKSAGPSQAKGKPADWYTSSEADEYFEQKYG